VTQRQYIKAGCNVASIFDYDINGPKIVRTVQATTRGGATGGTGGNITSHSSQRSFL